MSEILEQGKPLKKMTKRDLVDEFGDLHERAKEIEGRLKELKAEMVKRGGHFVGRDWETSVTEGMTMTSWNGTMLEDLLGERVPLYKKTTTYSKVNTPHRVREQRKVG